MKDTLDLEQHHAKTAPSPPTEPPILARILVWRDLNWTLVWGGPDAHGLESSNTWVNFALYEIYSFDLGEHAVYEKQNEKRDCETNRRTPHVFAAKPAFTGFIREHGCMQWRATPEYRFHMDERCELERMHEALERVRDLMRALTGQVEGRPNEWREP
jgi:hypothetical protein